MGFYVYNSINSTQKPDQWHNLSNYLLIVDAYSHIPKLYGMENIITEEVMEKLDMFQSRFGKIDQFVHNFCSSDILRAIKFWDLKISINNQ